MLRCTGRGSVDMDTQHASDAQLQQLQQFDQRQVRVKDSFVLFYAKTNFVQIRIGPESLQRPEEEGSLSKPHFVRRMQERVEVHEGQPVHFECRLQPANDPKMQVAW